MNPTKKSPAKVRDCPVCSSGQYELGVSAATKFGQDVSVAERVHHGLHTLVGRAAKLPGGGAIMVGEAERLRATIGEIEFATAASPASPRIMREREAQLENTRRRLDEIETALAALPEEAKVEPLQLVQGAEAALAAARASGADPEKILAKAHELSALKVRAASVIEERRKLQGEINNAVSGVMSALGGLLSHAFDQQESMVRSLTSGPEILLAPELLPVAKLRDAWRAATEIGRAGQVLGYVFSLADLEEAVPRDLLPAVRAAVDPHRLAGAA